MRGLRAIGCFEKLRRGSLFLSLIRGRSLIWLMDESSLGCARIGRSSAFHIFMGRPLGLFWALGSCTFRPFGVYPFYLTPECGTHCKQRLTIIFRDNGRVCDGNRLRLVSHSGCLCKGARDTAVSHAGLMECQRAKFGLYARSESGMLSTQSLL